ncbi:MAG: 30S ribosomal protein S17 [Candidatus Pacebacteria bacterium]|nr:30S ribosomal protein S17 [Candidatus Paceibacterota bacterium]
MNKEKRNFKGLVVSDKMDKTCVVKVDRLVKHPLFKKYYTVSKRYKAHDPENKYVTGDWVIITETKPISKDKKWIITEKVS